MKSLLVVTALFLGAGPARAAESSCAACHRKQGDRGALAHDFKDWERSAHGKAAVSCEACHGGNPLAADKAKAHEGVLRSTDKRGPLYFTNVPEACGACHKPELEAFKASAHYKELQRTGQGPNCVTCHGAMANHVLSAAEMRMTCTLCHRDPTRAYTARMGLTSAGAMVRRLDAAVARAKKGGSSSPSAEAALAEARSGLSQASIQWHTFDMPKVLETTARVKRRAATALKDLAAAGKR